jgi:hypothetical protein
MAHVTDRWHKTVGGARVRTDRYGSGKRWQAVWHDPATRREKTKAFAVKVDADAHVAAMQTDQVRGVYVDPAGGQLTYGAWAPRWRAGLTAKSKTLADYDGLLRLHVLPRWGQVPLGRIEYADVAAWVADLSSRLSASRTRGGVSLADRFA